MGYISPDMNPIHPIQTRPWIYTSYPIGDVSDDPFNNPPGFIQEIPYKTTPPICPECPIKHWRPLTIPQGLSGNTPIYYERGWDPVLGPTYRSPDGEYLPVNPNWILPGRADQERPCNPNGPGFDPSYNA
jgi:hypothetical protein